MSDIIDGILPSTEVSILAGASGAGKTTLLMQVLKMLQDGKEVFGHKAVKGQKVGYIAADRTWRAYIRLAEVVGIDLTKMHIKALIDDQDIDIDLMERSPQGLLYMLLKDLANKGCTLICVDPLVSLIGGDPNKYNMMAPRLIRLNRFCQSAGVTILGTHHAGKARTDFGFRRAQDRISGSSALLGFTSTHLFLEAAEESQKEYCEWHIVSHHAKAEAIKLKRTDPHGLFAQYTEVDELHNKSEKIADSAIKLMDFMPEDGTPMKRKDIVAALAEVASSATVDRMLAYLVSVGLLVQYPNGYYGRKTH